MAPPLWLCVGPGPLANGSLPEGTDEKPKSKISASAGFIAIATGMTLQCTETRHSQQRRRNSDLLQITETGTYVSRWFLLIHIVHVVRDDPGGVSMGTVWLWQLAFEVRFDEPQVPPKRGREHEPLTEKDVVANSLLVGQKEATGETIPLLADTKVHFFRPINTFHYCV